ncbi:hypothetical protein IJ21_45980 [Paenibacillus sp. 32O-W]|uniref:DUF6199 family natural product biosynthesis protein n=1 Tax=Paenibacillus sp. 32O-W TaxID=1695218 RepID=UPI00071FD0EC|nr:hypothetical protein IJ21_45980 [Paenibacillus sp. 32O-W]
MGFISLLLIILGLFMFIRPSIVWKISESWKSYNASEPSGLYVASTRIGAVLFILAGIGGVLVNWIL